VQFTYEADEPVKEVSLEVVWNSDFIIDDNYGITGRTFSVTLAAKAVKFCIDLDNNDAFNCSPTMNVS